MRGMRVALVEKGDYASGTSSKSSKMVHGGVRYLEQYQFGLVFESVRERAVQRRLNPHLVWPMAYCFPVFKGDRNPLWKINLGLWLYDVMSWGRGHKRHKKLNPKQTAEKVPGLMTDGMSGSVYYYDCGTDDARLTLANALSAERSGATVLNYVRYDAPVYGDDGAIASAQLTDELTGDAMTVKCRHVVYCGGPWTDTLTHAAGDGRLLRRTKGIHIVVARERFPIPDVVAAVRTKDQRPCFAVPYGDCIYIGTTDTDYAGDLDAIEATAEDITYLLDTINHYFPDARLTPADVRSTWSGLRPLVLDDDVTDASKTSREHALETDRERGITTIAGGKLTTYRSMAEEVLDSAITALRGREGATRPANCTTHKVALDPELPAEESLDSGFDRMLWRHHGSAMAWIKARMVSHPDEAGPLSEGTDYVLAQVSWAVLGEHAERLADVLVRRLQVFYKAPDQGLEAARTVAEHMARLLERNADWVEGEVERYRREVALSRTGVDALTQGVSVDATSAGRAVG